MLVFVIPLKSPQASNNWEKVSQLFARCLKSVCNQTSDSFQVIVVCHQQPNIDWSHPRVNYLKVDFPVPENPDIRTKRKDRVRKVITGYLQARQLNPSHVMKVDADDCVSKHIAAFVEQNIQSNGWLVNSGYEYRHGSRFIYRRTQDFYRHCGTSTIINYQLLNLPENPETLEYDKLIKYHLPHSRTDRILQHRGITLDYLPFNGAVYAIKNGENTYPRDRNFFTSFSRPQEMILYLKEKYKLLNSRPLNQAICAEFGLDYQFG